MVMETASEFTTWHAQYLGGIRNATRGIKNTSLFQASNESHRHPCGSTAAGDVSGTITWLPQSSTRGSQTPTIPLIDSPRALHTSIISTMNSTMISNSNTNPNTFSPGDRGGTDKRPTLPTTAATMPTNESLKRSSSSATKLCLAAPKVVIDSVASVALKMKRRLSLTHIDNNSTESKKIREEPAPQQHGGNAEWGTVSCSALPVGSAFTSLFSSVLADNKHHGAPPKRQASATSIVATGAAVAPEQTNKSTAAYKHTIIFGESSSSSICNNQQDATKELISPTDTVRNILQSCSPSSSTETLKYANFFTKPAEEQIAAYDGQKTTAVRNGDMATLRSLLEAGENLNCCNKFGESLIHMACRRAHIDVVRFLLQEAKVSLNARDDYGRTPLHDCCWRPSSNYELMELLLSEVDPRILLVEDVRGHAPFDYSRKDQWEGWNDFLESRKELLLSRLAEVTKTSAEP